MTYRFILCAGIATLLAACTPQATSMPATTDAPGSPSTLNVADAAIAGGDPSMALSVSQSVLSTDPHNSDALIHEGDAFYALGRCPAAMAAFNLALQYDAKSSPAETGLGRCLIKTDPRAAEQALILAVQDDPGNAAAFNDLGIARDMQGNFAGAVEPYQKALVDQPGMTAAEVNLGLSLALSGQGQQALQYLGPLATGQGSTPKIREDYAAALVATGQVDQARHVLSIDLAPDDVTRALDGFNAIIANAQPPLQGGPQPQPPTAPQVQTASVAATSLTPMPAAAESPPPSMPAPAATPVPAANKPPAESVPVSTNPNAAYTGPSPIPGAISSSMPDLTNPPADASPADSSPAGPPPAGDAAKPLPAKLVVTAPANLSPAANTAASVTPAEPSGDGSFEVQLGALPSKEAAQRSWDRISGANPALFNDKSPNIQSVSINGKTFYRLRTGTFVSKADAAKFCGEVSAAGSVCTLANF